MSSDGSPQWPSYPVAFPGAMAEVQSLEPPRPTQATVSFWLWIAAIVFMFLPATSRYFAPRASLR